MHLMQSFSACMHYFITMFNNFFNVGHGGLNYIMQENIELCPHCVLSTDYSFPKCFARNSFINGLQYPEQDVWLRLSAELVQSVKLFPLCGREATNDAAVAVRLFLTSPHIEVLITPQNGAGYHGTDAVEVPEYTAATLAAQHGVAEPKLNCNSII